MKTQAAEKMEEIRTHDKSNSQLDEPVVPSKLDPLASPTKGILLTPGTGTTRRKTVSFGTLLADAQKEEEISPSLKANLGSALKSRDSEVPQKNPRIQPRHSSLTKTLIELSKQKPQSHATSTTSSEEEFTREAASSFGIPTENTDQIADITVDLSQPRSRSGQHWKTEYEQYHKRSSREMKKMIMYGQNVKSYALKKDSEATGLGEKLKKELAKVAAMEKKVSKLAAQLNTAYANGPGEESEQTRLVGELAQQTALAIRYKQKADNYRRAMQKENRADAPHAGEQDDTQIGRESYQESQSEADSPEIVTSPSEKGTSQAELKSLRMNAQKAEEQAAKLEAENIALKRSLARVKGEMMSYEARRQAREERFKRREEKCKAEQKACEAQLAKLTIEHQTLLLASSQSSKAEAIAHPQPTASHDILRRTKEDQKSSETEPVNGNQPTNKPMGQNRVLRPYISPRKGRSQKPAVDIWTLSSPRDADAPGGGTSSPSKEPTEVAPSSVKHDIHRTLKEINQNLIPDHSDPGIDSDPTKPHQLLQPLPNASSPPIILHTHNQNPTIITEPRRAMTVHPHLASSPAKFEPSDAMIKPGAKAAPSMATVGRSASLLSRVGSRTGTMTSVRGSALSAERAAAAKARLAKRSAEKKGRG